MKYFKAVALLINVFVANSCFVFFFFLRRPLARIILKVSMAQVIQLALKTRSGNQNETAISCKTTTKVMLPNRKTEKDDLNYEPGMGFV